MPIKSYNDGRRVLSKTDASSRVVTGQSKIAYHSNEFFSVRVRDPTITFKYYAYGDYIGTTRFYWNDTSAGTLTEVSVVSSNGNTYNSGMTGEQHATTGLDWYTGTITLTDFETSGFGRFVIRHQISSDTSNWYTGDWQIDNIKINAANGTTHDLDPDLYRTHSNNQFWQRSTTYNVNWSSSHSWTDVAVGTSGDNIWNYDAGGTPSTGTADTVNSDGSTQEYYLYAEASGGYSRFSYLQTKNEYDLSTGGQQ